MLVAGRRLQLASYGIETAADITKQRVLVIPGFGNAIANSLVAWRRSVEAKFIFNAAAPIDPKEIANVKAQILKQKASKVAEVRRFIRQLDSVAVDIKSRRRPMQHSLQARYWALKQAECDFNAAKFAPQVPSPLVIIFIILGVALLGGLLKSVGHLEPQPMSPDTSRPILTPKSTPQEETTASTSQLPPKTDKWLSDNTTSPQNLVPPPTKPEPNSTNFVGFVPAPAPNEPTSPSPPPTPLQMPQDVLISTEPAGELENPQKPSELQSTSSAKLKSGFAGGRQKDPTALGRTRLCEWCARWYVGTTISGGIEGVSNSIRTTNHWQLGLGDRESSLCGLGTGEPQVAIQESGTFGSPSVPMAKALIR